MLTDEKSGTVIAKNQEEVAWYNSIEQGKQYIKALKNRIEKAKKDLKLSAREIEQKFKEGAKASMESDKLSVKIHKKLLKFYEEQLS